MRLSKLTFKNPVFAGSGIALIVATLFGWQLLQDWRYCPKCSSEFSLPKSGILKADLNFGNLLMLPSDFVPAHEIYGRANPDSDGGIRTKGLSDGKLLIHREGYSKNRREVAPLKNGYSPEKIGDAIIQMLVWDPKTNSISNKQLILGEASVGAFNFYVDPNTFSTTVVQGCTVWREQGTAVLAAERLIPNANCSFDRDKFEENGALIGEWYRESDFGTIALYNGGINISGSFRAEVEKFVHPEIMKSIQEERSSGSYDSSVSALKLGENAGIITYRVDFGSSIGPRNNRVYQNQTFKVNCDKKTTACHVLEKGMPLEKQASIAADGSCKGTVREIGGSKNAQLSVQSTALGTGLSAVALSNCLRRLDGVYSTKEEAPSWLRDSLGQLGFVSKPSRDMGGLVRSGQWNQFVQNNRLAQEKEEKFQSENNRVQKQWHYGFATSRTTNGEPISLLEALRVPKQQKGDANASPNKTYLVREFSQSLQNTVPISERFSSPHWHYGWLSCVEDRNNTYVSGPKLKTSDGSEVSIGTVSPSNVRRLSRAQGLHIWVDISGASGWLLMNGPEDPEKLATGSELIQAVLNTQRGQLILSTDPNPCEAGVR